MKTQSIWSMALFILFVSPFVYAIEQDKLDSTTSNQAAIEVDHNNSEVRFSGEHAGMDFEGVFEKWSATLVLPPSDSEKIEATFYLKSAKTGDFTYDSTLPEGDWFDAETFPEGVFISDKIEKIDEGYLVEGELTLKAITNKQDFVLYKTDTGFKADFSINRLEYDIGVESDPEAEWVSRDIKMTLILNE